MQPPTRRPRRLRAGAWLLGGAIGTAAASLLVWAGCTVTPENYKLLSTFFDGVPDPAMNGPAGNVAGGDPRKSPTYSLHRPYEEERCDACHKVGLRPSRNDSGICLACHSQVPAEYRFMHGPVAAAACMWCHAPHESPYAALLRDVDRKVCSQCHTPAMLAGTKVPEHTDESRGCLECHTGHGGPEPYMLRSAARGEKPAAKPEK